MSDARLESQETRVVVLGEFLGAGKSTALLRIARMLDVRAPSIGIITNDQSNDLVDTVLLRSPANSRSFTAQLAPAHTGRRLLIENVPWQRARSGGRWGQALSSRRSRYGPEAFRRTRWGRRSTRALSGDHGTTL